MPIHNKTRIKGVLFDFDGTLTFPGALDFPAIKGEIGCPLDTPILEFIESLPKERRARPQEILEVREEQAARNSKPNSGAENCLGLLKTRGIPLGILTRNSLNSVRCSLEGFDGINMDDFAAVVTREDCLPKPHPDGVIQAADQMGISASDLLMVGDYRFDVMAGNAAGAITALLLNDHQEIMIPSDPEPDFRIHHLEEILELVP